MTERNGPGAVGGLSDASTCSEKANGEKQETPPEVHSGEVEEHPRGGSAASPGSLAEAPDGGWGWVVLLATIVVLALTLAFPSCVGIFYTDLQNDFHASNSETSWVPSIMTSVLHAGGRVLNLFSQCSVTLSASECIQVCLPAYRITCYVFIIFYFGFTVIQHSASCCCFFYGVLWNHTGRQVGCFKTHTVSLLILKWITRWESAACTQPYLSLLPKCTYIIQDNKDEGQYKCEGDRMENSIARNPILIRTDGSSQ